MSFARQKYSTTRHVGGIALPNNNLSKYSATGVGYMFSTNSIVQASMSSSVFYHLGGVGVFLHDSPALSVSGHLWVDAMDAHVTLQLVKPSHLWTSPGSCSRSTLTEYIPIIGQVLFSLNSHRCRMTTVLYACVSIHFLFVALLRPWNEAGQFQYAHPTRTRLHEAVRPRIRHDRARLWRR